MADDIIRWLKSLGLDKYTEVFVEHEIDLAAAGHLTEADLRELDIPMGPRKKLLHGIAELSGAGDALSSAGSTTTQQPATLQEAERRLLTVWFCDLVGWTALSGTFDPEDMRELQKRFQNAVSVSAAKYHGYVAQFVGDGVLVYFGWPRAHEDQSIQAVRAGLEVVRTIQDIKTPTGAALAMRVGIASGLVVVGDLLGDKPLQSGAATGETINLAARLQGLAEANQVLVDTSIQRLLGQRFELAPLGARALKGIAEPVEIWQVKQENELASRFDARHANTALTTFVGRDDEFAFLLERWERTKAGNGSVVLVSGEAGIGKSRMWERLRRHVAAEPHTRLQYFCSNQYSNTALYPFTKQLERAAEFARGDTVAVKAEKIAALIGPISTTPDRDVALVLELMGLSHGDQEGISDLSAREKKEGILDGFVTRLTARAETDPLLMVLEDAHWSDPTSIELFNRLIEAITTSPVLLVITARPEFQPDWLGQRHVEVLGLERLPPEVASRIVADQAIGKSLPDAVVEQIVDYSDGIPLFIEELTRSILESGYLDENDEGYALSGPLPPMAMPTTLQASLVSRLDRLASVKDVAQIGAAIGREFDYELIGAVAAINEDQLQLALEVLVGSGLLLRIGMPPNAKYRFKHALVQDAAYNTLLKSRRVQLHDKIAQSLKRLDPDISTSQPELLAHHWDRAGNTLEAIGGWQRAAVISADKYAHTEAISFSNRALYLISTLPKSKKLHAIELEILLNLAWAYRMSKGYGADETLAAVLRLRDILHDSDDSKYLLSINRTLYARGLNRADYRASLQVAREFLNKVSESRDKFLLGQAHRLVGSSSLFLADFVTSERHGRIAYNLLNRENLGISALQPAREGEGGLSVLEHLAIALWHRGQIHESNDLLQSAISQSAQSTEPSTLANFWQFGGVVLSFFKHDNQGLRRAAEKLVDVGSTCKMAPIEAIGLGFKAGSLIRSDQHHEGADLLRRAIAYADTLNMKLYRAIYSVFDAEAKMATQQYDGAIEEVDKGLNWANDTAEHWADVPLLLTKASAMQSAGATLHQIVAVMELAIDTATKQGSVSLEKRARAALANLA